MEASGRGVNLGIFLHAGDELIGHLALFGILRGGFQDARIGYMLAERHSGQGYATEAVNLAVAYAFGELDLHRLETGVQLDNPASARVLSKAGFREEGMSLRWVQIAEAWEDCLRFALTKEEFAARFRERFYDPAFAGVKQSRSERFRAIPLCIIPAKAGIHSSTATMRQGGSRLSPG